MTPSESTSASTPTNDERLLAAIAHAAIFFGFWMLGPIAVYAMKRTESRHASFHAMQALVLWAIHIPVTVACMVGGFVVMIVAGTMAPRGGAAMLLTFGWLGALLLPTLAFMLISLVAAIRAYRGKTWSIPLVGRLARQLIAIDKGALQV